MDHATTESPSRTSGLFAFMGDGPVGPSVVNVKSIPSISPFRYPGGKTWMIPWIREWIASMPERPSTIIEPFAGGGIVSLTCVAEKRVGRAVMCEKDDDVAAVWTIVFQAPEVDLERLCGRIRYFEISREACLEALSRPPSDLVDRAFLTILRNRVNQGGVMARRASMARSGENGAGVSSRWYPTTLIRRLTSIRRLAARIDFVHGDAFDVLDGVGSDPTVAWFVDPPYSLGSSRAGARLYTHHEIDHERLFSSCAGAAGPVAMTYDDDPCVVSLADRHGMVQSRLPMKSGGHVVKHELVLTKPRSTVPSVNGLETSSG